MHPEKKVNKGRKITGWVISVLIILFLLFDSFGKLAKPETVVKVTVDLGYPESVLTAIGTILLICTILYAIPRTAVLGAVLLTGYMGGAIATHVRVENPLFSHTLFPVYIGILLWLGLWLRNRKRLNLFFNES